MWRPDLIVIEGFEAPALQAAAHRWLRPRSRLLLCVSEAPASLNPRARMILRMADGLLADGEAVARACAALRFPPARIFSLPTPHDLDDFLACDRARASPEAHRIVYAGDLSARSGAADVLLCLATLAERNPGAPIEIWWVGEGDLVGVLAAQPLPAGLSQRFLGRLDRPGLAAAFAQCGLLIASSCVGDMRQPVREALAAGLLAIGNRNDPSVRRLVREGANGWLFDPSTSSDCLLALDRALRTPVEQLDRMRRDARDGVHAPAAQCFAERFRDAFEIVMPEAALPPDARRRSWPQQRAAQ